MKKNATKLTLGLLILLMAAGVAYWAQSGSDQSQKTLSSAQQAEKNIAAFSDNDEKEDKASKVKSKKARQEYFFRLMRDPATNAIPENIRSREINHAKSMPSILQVTQSMKAQNPAMKVAEGFEWRLAGPPAVGGRTRALGIDQRNSNIIIAGGVSGGIWKSTDGGDNWQLRTPDFENFSVTSLAQDPTTPDTWYYTSGEFLGNSASAPGATYYGTGVFRSTDNGDSWSRISGTEDDNTQFDSQFDYINRVTVSPTTGTVFIASNGIGIFRSTTGNGFENLTLGGFGEHLFADVTAASDGRLAAVLSSSDAGEAGGNPGIFVSNDDGQTWTDITPSTFPANYDRSVVTFAPSDPNIIYVLTNKAGDTSTQGVSFHMIDISGGVSNVTSEDRSANLPDFGPPVGGLNLQGGYNMTVSVKPDDPEIVTLGGTDLFRSFDGFATGPTGDSDAERDEFWIGGYAKANNVSLYPNQHPDQHVQIYDPSDPSRLWVGHDGGLSVTEDVTATSVSWTDRNEGYIVTQFYDASLAPGEGDNRFMGGTQDNGTPFFEFRKGDNIGDASADISSGDGGFSFFTENFIYVSNQQGGSGNNRVIRFNGDFSGTFAIVQPLEAQTAFFITPYTIDPNDEGIMYYPGGSSLFRNTMVDEITSKNNAGASEGWERLSSAGIPGFNISALTVTTLPRNILYYAGSNGTDAPVVKRLDNASSSNQQPTDISIPDAPEGAFVHDIAVNPANGNDVLVVMSNYNIVGLYHTSDGGSSWEAVEGNLVGENDPESANPGPSLRSATIVASESGAIYMLGTSTGIYATQNLAGSNTDWGRESAFDSDGIADIGFSVVENIRSRFSDGDVAVGTHGRGMFVGRFQGETDSDIPLISLDPSQGRAGNQVVITAINFQFSTNPSANQVTFGGVQAQVVSASQSQITITVPEVDFDATDDRTVQVNVVNNNGDNPQPAMFTYLPDLSIEINPSEGRAGEEVVITATNFNFDTTPAANEVFFAGVQAEVTEASPSQLTVLVPENLVEEGIDELIVTVTYNNPNGPDPEGVQFTVLNDPIITLDPGDPDQGQPGDEVIIKATNFDFSTTPSENKVFFSDDRAEVIAASESELTVIVPRGSVPRNEEPNANGNFDVIVSVETPDLDQPVSAPFEILPPDETSMGQNVPNPFSIGDDAFIPINLQRSSTVTLEIYDTSGRRVDQTLDEESFQAGTHDISINFGNRSSGIYIYRVIIEPANGSGETVVDSRKFTFIR